MDLKQGTVIAFTADKNGKPVAYRQAFMMSRLRWVRVNMDDAKLGVATGRYTETDFHPWHPVDCLCSHCATCAQCTGSYRKAS